MSERDREEREREEREREERERERDRREKLRSVHESSKRSTGGIGQTEWLIDCGTLP